MFKIKFHHVLIILLTGCLIIILARNLFENSKPLKIKIDEALTDYDDNYLRTITNQFHNDKLYAFYETINNNLKVVSLENDTIKSLSVEELISESPMLSDRVVSWQGIGNSSSGTNLLYGIINDPEITQLFVESEDNYSTHIFKVDEARAVWFKFLEDRVNIPVIITATDRTGNEKFYFGPERGNL
ncbi:hypothetical protein GE107_25900 [Cohnella sp. CFH 77786]|uniref:hypothetical protein n=1 Tax=Cohnella sp. CFH 77786 TaxID=2662265 RepID=UPI001C608353|nr:hypothetical protein [Cohnella sp. CFH 77786]MBW5449448.1 hypothetical protein [Cohnella sp. CFH 77786]